MSKSKTEQASDAAFANGQADGVARTERYGSPTEPGTPDNRSTVDPINGVVNGSNVDKPDA